MSDRPTATIHEFPRKPEDAQARLQRALDSLEQALAEQRRAVSDWRDALATLHGSVRGLGRSLGGYQASLGELAERVDGINRQARQLEAWADGVLASP
jgi:uncharacterized coiled-coil protein SlyX